MIKPELLEKAQKFLKIHGKLSIPFLQVKLKVSFEIAKEIFKILRFEK